MSCLHLNGASQLIAGVRRAAEDEQGLASGMWVEALALVAPLLVAVPALPSGPDACFPTNAQVDSFLRPWYCRNIHEMGEGVLAGDPAYRFTYIPSFHKARMVIVSLENGQPFVVGIVLGRRTANVPGPLEERTRRSLTQDEWKLLLQRLQNAGLWEPTDRNISSGADGAHWLLEARMSGRYQLHDVWSPDDRSFPQYFKACRYMLELARILPQDHELY